MSDYEGLDFTWEGAMEVANKITTTGMYDGTLFTRARVYRIPLDPEDFFNDVHIRGPYGWKVEGTR